MTDEKGTTIYVPESIHRELTLLKAELKKGNYAEVIQELIKLYRKTHGWSTLSIAEGLKNIRVEE